MNWILVVRPRWVSDIIMEWPVVTFTEMGTNGRSTDG